MFSAFMWSFARSPNAKKIKGQTIVQPLPGQNSNSKTSWQFFTLENDTLTKLAQSIERTGLGSLGEIYMSIIPPLSAEEKLPDAGVVVNYINQQCKKHQLGGSWESAAEMYLWVFNACSHKLSKSSSTTSHITKPVPTASTRATVALIEFLESLSTEAERGKEQQLGRAMDEFVALHTMLIQYVNLLQNFGSLKPLYQKQGRSLAWLYRINGPGMDQGLLPDDRPSSQSPTDHDSIQDQLQEVVGQQEVDGMSHVNEKDVLGWSELHYAARKGEAERIGTLVEAGADWGSEHLREWTPLHCAAANKSLELEWKLIRDGVDVNTQARDGFSPLHCAAQSGNAKMAALLIQSGANLQIYDNSRRTALHLAANHGSTEVASLILQYGASPRAIDEFGRTALHLAAMKGFLDIVEPMAKAMSDMIDVKERDGWTATHMAVLNGYSDVVKVLLEHGADVNLGRSSESMVHMAISGGHKGILKVLLQHGANPSATMDTQSALHMAIEKESEEIVKLLLDYGANASASMGAESALHAAIGKGNGKMVKLLLDHGANINARRGTESTLCAAAETGNYEIVKLLLDHGADIRESTLDAAAGKGHHEILQLLLDRGVDPSTINGIQGAPDTPTTERQQERVQSFLASPSAKRGTGGTQHATANKGHRKRAEILHPRRVGSSATGNANIHLPQAIFEQDAYMVKLLLDNGVNPNTEGDTVFTMHMAIKYENKEIVKLLLDHGANPNASVYTRSALHAAIDKGNEGIVKLLLDHGADISVMRGTQSTLEAATNGGYQRIVELLMSYRGDANSEDGEVIDSL